MTVFGINYQLNFLIKFCEYIINLMGNIYKINDYNKNELIEKNLEYFNYNFNYIISSQTFIIGLNENKYPFIWGKINFNNIFISENEQILEPIQILEEKIQLISCNTKTICLLTEKGQLYYFGENFSPFPILLNISNLITNICSGNKTFLIFGDFGLRIYTSNNTFIEYNLYDNFINMISSYRDIYFILLTNGELLTTKELSTSIRYNFPRNDQLYYFMPFFGLKISLITIKFGFFCIIAEDSTLYIGNLESSVIQPIQIPIKLKKESLINVIISNSKIFLLTYEGNTIVLKINKLFAPNWSGLISNKKKF